MPSTLLTTATYAACTLLPLLTAAHSHHPAMLFQRQAVKRAGLTYEGCYSSSSGLSDQGSYMYQTSSYCQPICVKQNQAVLATSGGSDCWCGDLLPPASSKVDDSNCDVHCNGYGQEMCGGNGFYSVYLSGTSSSVGNYGGGDSSSSSSSDSPSSSSQSTSSASSDSSSTSSTPTTSTTATPSVITSVAPGQTVVITAPASQSSPSSSATPTASPSAKPNTAGIAAGVVVGVVALAAIIAGVFFFLRRQRRQHAEDEYKRSTQVSDFMRGTGGAGEPKPPPSAYSTKSDSRLDPEAARRNSAGSIADDGDFSRRILRVANPDNSGH